MHDDDLRRELERLRQRVERIERRLELPEEPAEIQPSPVPAAVPHPDAETARPPIPAPPPISTSSSAPAPPPISTSSSAPAPPPIAPPTAPPTAPPVAPAAPAAAARPAVTAPPAAAGARSGPTKSGSPLEVLIGGKLAAWVGAIVIVMAAAFAVKLGIDEGWWGLLSPTLRCLLIALFGGALVGGGVLALKRISRAASVGLFGAGLGVLYLDAFASFATFDLLAREWAFVLMGAVALGGFAITVWTRFRTIGVISLVGGYLTPILLAGGGGHDLEVLAYLTALFAIALGLSARRPHDFRALRYVALGGHMLVGLVWVVSRGPAEWILAVVFFSLWWSMLLAETTLAAMRGQSRRGNPVALLIATTGYVTAGAWVLDGAGPAGPDWLGLFTLAIAVLGAVTALQFGTGLDALKQRAHGALDLLSVALWAQSGVLLTVAAALQFDGFGQSVSWLAVALVSIELGRRLPSRGVDVFGLIVGALAVIRIATVDWWISPALTRTIAQIGSLTVTGWSILALGGIIAVGAAAHRLRARPPHPWRVMPMLLTVVAALGWLAVCGAQASGATVTGGWLVGCVILLVLAPLGRRQAYVQIAIMLLVAAAARWLVVDAFAVRLDPQWSATSVTPLLNPQMGLAVAVAAVGWWSARLVPALLRAPGATTPTRPAAAEFVLVAAALFLLVGLSFETDRVIESIAAARPHAAWSVGHVRQLAWTALWSIGAVGLGLIAATDDTRAGDRSAAVRRPTIALRAAWALLALCAVKWVAVDTVSWDVSGGRAAALSLTPFVNLQLLAGAAVAGAALLLVLITGGAGAAGRPDPTRDPWAALVAWAPVAAAIVVLWGLSFEVDRLVERGVLDSLAPRDVAPALLRTLWWTALWGLGAFAMQLIGRWRRRVVFADAGAALLAASAIAWLTFGTLFWRLRHGPLDLPVIGNLQFGVGAVLLVMLALQGSSALRFEGSPAGSRAVRAAAAALVAALALWLGSLEIDRFFADQPMAAQAGLSVYWATAGVVLVVLGFARRAAFVRYAGLALLAVTVAKVLFIDLATVDRVWRVLSFLVSGLLLVGTSLIYMKVSPRLGERASGIGEARDDATRP